MGRRLVSRAYGVVGIKRSLLMRDARLVVVDKTVVSRCVLSFLSDDTFKIP